MTILLIILSIIGLLKLVSLFILALLQIYYYIKGNNVIEAHRDSCFYIEDNFYIFPTIAISYTNKYFEIIDKCKNFKRLSIINTCITIAVLISIFILL